MDMGKIGFRSVISVWGNWEKFGESGEGHVQFRNIIDGGNGPFHSIPNGYV